MFTTDTIVDYDALKSLRGRIERELDRARRINDMITQQVEILQNGCWESEAARHFYREMQECLLRWLLTLIECLLFIFECLLRIIELMQSAEERAAACIPSIA